MAVRLAKLSVTIGAGLFGSALSKEGCLSEVTSFLSGALKIVRKHLQNDKDSSQSTNKPHVDSLLTEIIKLRQELQLLASSRSALIVAGSRSGLGTSFSVTTIVVIGVVGCGFLWWKGWKISDMMFESRRGFSDACNSVGKQLELLSSSLAATRRQLSSRIDCLDSNVNGYEELNVEIRDEVLKLRKEVNVLDVESVRQLVQTLDTKLVRCEEMADSSTKGIYFLCEIAQKLQRSEIPDQDSASSYRQTIEPSEHTVVTKMISTPPLAPEPPTPSTFSEHPKVLHKPKMVATTGLKELQISNTIKERDLRPSSYQQRLQTKPL